MCSHECCDTSSFNYRKYIRAKSLFMRYLFIFLFIILVPRIALSQWIQLGPGSGDVDAIERVGGYIWAGTDVGIFISYDEGESWTRNDQFEKGRYILLDRVGNSIYTYGTYSPVGEEGLYRSTDEGVSFELVSQSLAVGPSFIADQVDIVECNDRVFFRSSRDMFSAEIGVWDWERVELPSLKSFSTLRAANETLVVSSADTMSISIDCGQTWLVRVPEKVATFVQYIEGNTLYAMRRTFGERWISNDFGLTWGQQSRVGLQFQDKIIQLADGTLFEVGLNVFYSSSINEPWTEIETRSYGFVEDALLLNNGEILLCGSNGLLRMDVDRTTVTPDPLGPPTHDIKQIFSSEKGVYVAPTIDDNIQSFDGGYEWRNLGIRVAKPSERADDVKGIGWIQDTMFTVVNSSNYKLVIPYSFSRSFFQEDEALDLLIVDDKIFVLGENGLYRSTDGGRVFDLYPISQNSSNVDRLEFSAGYLFLKGQGSEMYRVASEGASSLEFLQASSSDFIFLDDLMIRCTGQLWSYSTDAGANWVDYNMTDLNEFVDSQGNYRTPHAVVRGDDSLYLATFDGSAVFASGDNGVSWQERTFNLSGDQILSLAYDPMRNALLAGVAGRSLWAYYPSTSTNTSTAHVAEAFSIQAFPNPASSSVQLTFSADLPQKVRFSLFSSSGQQLSPYVVNRDNKKALLVVEHLPEGLYYVAVQIDKELVITPIMVAR